MTLASRTRWPRWFRFATTLMHFYNVYVCFFIAATTSLAFLETSGRLDSPIGGDAATANEWFFYLIAGMHLVAMFGMVAVWWGLARMLRRRDQRMGVRPVPFLSVPRGDLKAILIYIPWWNIRFLKRLLKEEQEAKTLAGQET